MGITEHVTLRLINIGVMKGNERFIQKLGDYSLNF